MIRRRITIGSVVLLVMGMASVCAWFATARFTFEDPTMPSPDLYVVKSMPGLGWLSVLSFAAAVPLLLVRPLFPTLRAERRRRGCCLHCGYDLQAGGDCCPECGTPIPSGGRTTP